MTSKVLPALVLGMALDKPGYRPAANGVKILSGLRRRGYKPGYLAGDRAYNNSKPEEWQLPVRAMGYKPVYDYTVDQLGKQAETHGAILVEGTWYCPSMPQPLIDATSDLYAGRIDRATWAERIAARKAHRLVPKQHEDGEGHQRQMCPAEAGKVQCLLKPRSLGNDPRLPLLDPEPNPIGPYKVCRQRSVTMAPAEGAKHWQPLNYGTPEWQKIYFRLRNSVEGYNGFAKNPLAEAIEQAGSRRIRGIAAQTVLLVFQLAHANQRKIRTGSRHSPSTDNAHANAPITGGRPNPSAPGHRPDTWQQGAEAAATSPSVITPSPAGERLRPGFAALTRPDSAGKRIDQAMQALNRP